MHKCFICGCQDEGAIDVCRACHNDPAVRVEKIHPLISKINELAASKFKDMTMEEAAYQIQLLSHDCLVILSMEIGEK